MKEQVDYRRKIFAQIAKQCKKYGITPEESFLRTSVVLADGQGAYDFNILESMLNKHNDVVLSHGDIFIPYNIGIMLSFDKADPIGNASMKGELFPYAPKAKTENFAGFIGNDIEALYNGVLSITIGQDTVNRSFPMLNFKHVPETNGQFDSMDCLYPLAPVYYLSGKDSIRIRAEFEGTASKFQVGLGTAPTEPTETLKPFMHLLMMGVLIPGGAEIKDFNITLE